MLQFHFGDVVFGVYQLALHHSTVNAMDTVEGHTVTDPTLIAYLLEVCLSLCACGAGVLTVHSFDNRTVGMQRF
jgi:hypothetical protein